MIEIASRVSRLGLTLALFFAMIEYASAQIPNGNASPRTKTVDHAMFRAMKKSIDRLHANHSAQRGNATQGTGSTDHAICRRPVEDCPISP